MSVQGNTADCPLCVKYDKLHNSLDLNNAAIISFFTDRDFLIALDLSSF